MMQYVCHGNFASTNDKICLCTYQHVLQLIKVRKTQTNYTTQTRGTFQGKLLCLKVNEKLLKSTSNREKLSLYANVGKFKAVNFDNIWKCLSKLY